MNNLNCISKKTESEIIEFYNSGNNQVKTATQFGISQCSVWRVLERNNINRRDSETKFVSKISESQKKDIIKAYEGGKSTREVGALYKISQPHIFDILKKNKVKLRPRGSKGEKNGGWRGGINSNKEHCRKRTNIYLKKRRTIDQIFKLKCDLRSQINIAIKSSGYKKQSRANSLLGADFIFIKNYLESQFQDGMTWKNHGNKHGEWSIDHKIPLASANNEDELFRLFHYSNIQPLWHTDNLKKNSFYNGKRHYRRAA